MRITAITAVFGLLLVAAFAAGEKNGPLGAAEPAPGTPDASPDAATKQLIDDLNSDDWRTREKAGRALTAKGEAALPLLRKAMLATDSPEMQRRLTVLVRKMDHARLVEPKRVTLAVKDRTAKQIFEEITKQTGYKIEFNDSADIKLSFDFKDTPFWQAVDTVANAAGCTLVTNYGDDVIRIFNQESMDPLVGYAGPFRILPTNISTSRSMQLSGISKRGENQRNNEYTNLSFQVQSEPKNPIISINQPEILEAKDDLGGSLLLSPEDRNNFRTSHYFNGGSSRHSVYMSATLNHATRAATSIKSLKGRVTMALLAGTAPELVIADPLKVKKKEFIGRSADIELTSTDEDANQKGNYSVSLTAKRHGAGDPIGNDYMWAQNLWQRLELSDDKGNLYFCHGPTVHKNGGDSLQLVLTFGPNDNRTGRPGPNKLGPPTKLVLTEWLTAQHEVTFAFKDIPLP
jgi:hypothetical protein